MSQTKLSSDLSFALDLCREAGKLVLKYFKEGVEVSMKPDNTPVTIADKECEKFLRAAISNKFPDDGILGEEEAARSAGGNSNRKWILDPVDGTYNFARGISIFSILLALEIDGEIRAGIVHNPAREETYYAEKGAGAYRNGQRLKVSEISKIEDSQFVFGAPNRILSAGLWSGFTRLIEKSYRQRGLGDYLNFAYVFEGRAEAALEVGLSPWDIAPMKIIAEEAGGRFTDLDGGSSVYSGSCLVSNARVHDTYLRLLKMS
ncbi:MAG: inositol monophosphatase [Candidatus Obscuribacterales bacterium]|nr:inositol monophosphatase [Candidatus Obscuribacterales bacterium]